MSEFKEVNEIIIRVAGPTKAGKTAVASVVDNALRANGIQAKVESDSSLSYLRDAKNFIPSNIEVRLIDGDGGVERDFGLFDAIIPIKGRIKSIQARENIETGIRSVYRIEFVKGVDLSVWVGDFENDLDVAEAALGLANKYGVEINDISSVEQVSSK